MVISLKTCTSRAALIAQPVYAHPVPAHFVYKWGTGVTYPPRFVVAVAVSAEPLPPLLATTSASVVGATMVDATTLFFGERL